MFLAALNRGLAMTRLEKMKEEGVLPPEAEQYLSSDDIAVIESLSDDEFNCMISGGQRLGPEMFKRLGEHGIYF